MPARAVEQVVLRLPPGQTPESLGEAGLRTAAARALERPADEIGAVRLRRVSFDARPRHLEWRLVAEVWPPGETPPAAAASEPPTIPPPQPGAPRAVVIGSGPAGMFCALELLRAGVNVTLLERGKDVQARRRDVAALNRGEPADPESNYCFGEGGAGTYSDGKLYTRSGAKGAVRDVLECLVAHGAPREILVSWRPHVGSNRLPKVVTALRATLERSGAAVRFEARAVEIVQRDGTVRGVRLADGEEIAAEAVVLATGHSALDSLEMARRAGAQLEPKGFAMGVRLEHPQAWVDERQYHAAEDAAALPPAFYELAARAQDRGVYSFCMCPGGWIVPSQTEPASLVVNGMSLSKRDSPYANSGVVVSIEPADWCGKRGARWGWPELLRRAAAQSTHPLLHEPPAVADGRLPERPADDPLFGVRLQVALETLAALAGGPRNRAPAQRADHFVAARGETAPPLPTSYLPGLTPADFHALLPRGLAVRLRAGLQEFDRRLPGYAGPTGQLVGVETRTSSPVRVVRDPHSLESPTLARLYPCGEGAGFAGGIVSAALDGQRVARALAARAGRAVGSPPGPGGSG